MSGSKHPKLNPDAKPRDDLQDNPGIGTSKGVYATGTPPEDVLDANTVEGDTMNATRDGAVDPAQTVRTNK